MVKQKRTVNLLQECMAKQDQIFPKRVEGFNFHMKNLVEQFQVGFTIKNIPKNWLAKLIWKWLKFDSQLHYVDLKLIRQTKENKKDI